MAVITSGFLIAFTSTFIEKLVWSQNHDGSVKGFLRGLDANGKVGGFSLADYKSGAYTPGSYAYYEEGDCFFKSWRGPDGSESVMYYNVLFAKMTFVVVYEHTIFFLRYLLSETIPDIPEEVDNQIKKRDYQEAKALENTFLDPEHESESKDFL